MARGDVGQVQGGDPAGVVGRQDLTDGRADVRSGYDVPVIAEAGHGHGDQVRDGSSPRDDRVRNHGISAHGVHHTSSRVAPQHPVTIQDTTASA